MLLRENRDLHSENDNSHSNRQENIFKALFTIRFFQFRIVVTPSTFSPSFKGNPFQDGRTSASDDSFANYANNSFRRAMLKGLTGRRGAGRSEISTGPKNRAVRVTWPRESKRDKIAAASRICAI
jgi:hypothetical protein